MAMSVHGEHITELSGVDEALEHVRSGALSPAAPGPVGLELEAHLVDLQHPATGCPGRGSPGWSTASARCPAAAG